MWSKDGLILASIVDLRVHIIFSILILVYGEYWHHGLISPPSKRCGDFGLSSLIEGDPTAHIILYKESRIMKSRESCQVSNQNFSLESHSIKGS